MRQQSWAHAAVLGLLSLFVGTGCPVAADFFNPNIFGVVGIDPNTIVPPQGTIIVLFTNNTQSPAVFTAFESSTIANFTSQNSRNFSVGVEAGQSQNEVLDCPLRIVTPGSFDDAGAFNNIAVRTGTGMTNVEVPYDGTPLQANVDFTCGDVIEIALNSVTGGGDNPQTAFAISVQVRPGR